MKNTTNQSDHHNLLAIGGILAAVALIALVVVNPEITGMAVEEGVEVGVDVAEKYGADSDSSPEIGTDVPELQGSNQNEPVQVGVDVPESYGDSPGSSVDSQPEPVYTPAPGQAVRKPETAPAGEGIIVNPQGVNIGSKGLANAGVIGVLNFEVTEMGAVITPLSGAASHDSVSNYQVTSFNPRGKGTITMILSEEQLREFLNIQLLRFDTQLEIKNCMVSDDCKIPFQRQQFGVTYEEEGINIFVPYSYFSQAFEGER